MISDVFQEQYAVRTFIEEAIHDGKIGLEAGFPEKSDLRCRPTVSPVFLMKNSKYGGVGR